MLFRLAGALLLSHQVVVSARMWDERSRKWAAAQATARELNKPLLVVGGPWGSQISGRLFGIKAHGCGDMCTDVDPEACAGCPYTYGDIRELPFADGEFGAVFCSHVLEHMPTPEDCVKAWAELHRVADEVLICLPPKTSVWAWLVPDHHLWVEQVSEDRLRIEDRHSPQVLYASAHGRPLAQPARAVAVRFDLQRLIPELDTT